ncbi:RNase P subunit p30 family protein [Salinirarus marinus]|uniref:RNase P subunit p30 family protein n=1 Tax=Salinirarus marinus TaxID=3068310 RepID=UPI003C6C2586
MYEAAYVYPDGDSTTARFAHAAGAAGYDGVVVRAVDGAGRRSAGGPAYDAVRDAAGVDVVDGAEVVAPDPEHASGAIGNLRPKHTLLLVRGGTDRLNRFAVEQERVDVLARPMADDGDFNHVLAKTATRNAVHVEFDFGPVLRSEGGHRVRVLQRLRKLRKLVEKYDTPYVVSATPDVHLRLRAPREMKALGEQVGFTGDWIEQGLEAWGELAARNRRRRSESFIEPGVERGRYEKDD